MATGGCKYKGGLLDGVDNRRECHQGCKESWHRSGASLSLKRCGREVRQGLGQDLNCLGHSVETIFAQQLDHFIQAVKLVRVGHIRSPFAFVMTL